MNEFKPSETLEHAVRTNDISSIRTCLVSIIKFDPMFQTTNFDDALEYAGKNHIKIDVPYEMQEDEFKTEKSEWDEDYFYLLTEWLRRNFAVQERRPHIQEVGRKVFKEKFGLIKTEDSPKPAPERCRRSQQVSKPASKLIALLAAAAVIAIIVYLFVKTGHQFAKN